MLCLGSRNRRPRPEFAPIVDDPKLPRVPLMGDSVSIADALEVRKLLAGAANVPRVPADCVSTITALGHYYNRN